MIGEPSDARGRELASWAVLVVALAFHLWALYTPNPPDAGGLSFPGLDKLAHVVIFALPTWALVRAVPRAWMGVVPMLVHVPVSELVQHFYLGQRTGDVWDAVADLVGVAVGWWTAVRARVVVGAED